MAPLPPVTSPARLLGMGQVSTTLYVADPQFEHLGPRVFTKNLLMDRLISSSLRNTAAVVTAPLFVDTLLDRVREGCRGENVRLQVLGDVPDTPCRSEMEEFEAVLARHDLPVDGYDRGNHSSSNAFGAINLLSGLYRFLSRKLRRPSWLERELCEACGGSRNVLTPRQTIQGMHRILHCRRPDGSTPEGLNVRVAEAGNEGYRLVGEKNPVPFDEAHRTQTHETFWRRSASDTPFWECLVNYDVADLPRRERKGRADPFYLQASEQGLEDGSEVPVYAISLDTQDHDHLMSVWPGVSEFQIRLMETFIDERLKENPAARFKLSSHFPTSKILGWYAGCGAKKALKRLLSRKEVVFFASAHTHEREVEKLTERLGLARETPLTEVTVPSLIDFHPVQDRDSKAYQDARALARERIRLESESGKPVLKIDVEYIGLDREDLPEATAEVDLALASYRRDHGYLRARETLWEIRKKYLVGFLERQFRRVTEFFTVAINPRHEKKFRHYWGEQSFVQNVVNLLTTASVVTMFNEAEHLIPLLESALRFVRAEDAGELAAAAQIRGILTVLGGQYRQRLAQFDAAVACGAGTAELRGFNDLFARAGVDRLPTILLQLGKRGPARAFAVLAGLEASREEYEFERGRPTKIPNRVPTITIPV